MLSSLTQPSTSTPTLTAATSATLCSPLFLFSGYLPFILSLKFRTSDLLLLIGLFQIFNFIFEFSVILSLCRNSRFFLFFLVLNRLLFLHMHICLLIFLVDLGIALICTILTFCFCDVAVFYSLVLCFRYFIGIPFLLCSVVVRFDYLNAQNFGI